MFTLKSSCACKNQPNNKYGSVRMCPDVSPLEMILVGFLWGTPYGELQREATPNISSFTIGDCRVISFAWHELSIRAIDGPKGRRLKRLCLRISTVMASSTRLYQQIMYLVIVWYCLSWCFIMLVVSHH